MTVPPELRRGSGTTSAPVPSQRRATATEAAWPASLSPERLHRLGLRTPFLALDTAMLQRQVTGFLAAPSRGGWLSLDDTVELLGCYGIPLADSIGVVSEDAAAAAAERFGGLVALRADVPGLLRTSDAGDVLTDERRRFRATVRPDGQLDVGVAIGSIHKVGALVQGLPACNGWTFWHAERAGKLVVIDTYRAKLRAVMGAAG